MKQTILFGNGFNRLSGKQFSWEEILKSNSLNVDETMNCPNHFVYENTLFSQIDSLTEDEVKSKIVHLLQDPQYSLETKGLYRKLFDLKAHYYLTTNYDYYGHYLCQLGFSHTHRYYDNNECVHSMHRKRVYKHVHDHRKISIFPIHGVAETPKTVMLGFDQYCAVIGRLERYMRLGKGVGKPNAPLYNEYRHWKKKHKNEPESYLNYHIDHRASCSDILSFGVRRSLLLMSISLVKGWALKNLISGGCYINESD